MIIRGTQTEHRKVQITVHPYDIFVELGNKALRTLDKNLNVDCFINDKGQIAENVEYFTSHSWDSEEVRIAEPTEAQLEAVKAFKLLKSLVHNIKDN